MAINGNRKEGVVKNRLLRYTLLTAGSFSVGLAILGIVLPLLPTTPFLLLAAACFYKSSPRFYNWLINNKLFGKYIRDYKDKKGVPLKVKIFALLFMWSVLLFSALYFVPYLWVQILLFGIAISVTVHILLIKTKRKV